MKRLWVRYAKVHYVFDVRVATGYECRLPALLARALCRLVPVLDYDEVLS